MTDRSQSLGWGQALLVAALVLAMVAPAAARRGRGGVVTVLLRLEGYFGPPPDGRSEVADLRLRIASTDRRFQVTKARLLSGDGLAADILADMKPHRPNLLLRGPEELLAQLTAAPDGRQVILTGHHRRGAFDMLVGSVEVAAP